MCASTHRPLIWSLGCLVRSCSRREREPHFVQRTVVGVVTVGSGFGAIDGRNNNIDFMCERTATRIGDSFMYA